MRTGYFVGGFPRQSHIFFWREVQALQKLGIDVEIVSTVKPSEGFLATHSWVGEAIGRTSYLFPPALADLLVTAVELFRAGPTRWVRCMIAVIHADQCTLLNRVHLLCLVPIGAQLAGLARRRGWAHVHVHFPKDAANIALFAHILAGLSYSITTHGALDSYGPNQKQKWHNAAFGISVSRAVLKELQQTLPGLLPESFRIAPMGVDMTVFRRSLPYVPWSGSGPSTVFCCGRLVGGKGHDVVIRSLAILHAKGFAVRLRIAGGPEPESNTYRAFLEKLIGELFLDGSVTLLGAVSEEGVRRELEAAHVFVLASDSEGAGVAIMEAMAMELPVVCTRVGGIPEVVENGVNGYLVEPGNPEQLADAILKLLLSPEDAARFARSNRSKIAQSFHSGISAAALGECLRRTCS